MTAFSLKNDIALVTGSSKGIGLAIGLGLKEAGAEVLFHGSRARPKEITAESKYLQIDLFQQNAPTELLRAAIQAQPALNLLICNAGSFFDVPFLEMTRERWEQTMQLNLTATYFIDRKSV